jgi:undecaprenyl-diphosphatase
MDGRMLLLFLVLAGTTFIFFKLASEVMEGDTMAFDRLVITSLRDAANPAMPLGPRWLNTAMLDLTAFGGVSGLTVLTMIVAGYLLVAGKKATALFLIAAVASGATLGTLLKLGFERPRPEIVAHLVQVNTTSFPSGHAMNSAVVYLTLGALLARTEPDWRVRTYIVAVAIALTAVIGFSRVYLGVHWPSDVLAGWVVGAIWAVLCSFIARALQARRTIEQAPTEPSQ